MSFDIDKQTLDELNLMGKFRQGSVYALFNKVKTGGGERLLNQMFTHPLEDVENINRRSATFRFFQQQQINFPFDIRQLGLMRDYLDTEAASNSVYSFIGMLLKKGLSALTRDERYKKIIQGLQSTIITLNICYAFTDNIKLAGHPYSDKIKQIRTLLSDERLEKLRNTDIYQEVPVKKLAYYDYLIKRKLNKQIEAVLAFIYELDVYIAIGTTARQKDFVYARALPEAANLFKISDLKHPCIEKAVGNDIFLEKNSNVLFLTGANMAGKSTMMKSVGIALYLAHMGFPIACREMEFSVRNGLYSSINISDNINLGYSHFYAEVLRVRQAAEAAASGKRLLLMFDELFKGTNVKDAYEGTLAVTEAFAAYKNCLFIVSTHIIEVGEALKGTPNIQFAYMPTVMNGNTPIYTYRLKDGITEDRQGMLIIQNEGIPPLLGLT